MHIKRSVQDDLMELINKPEYSFFANRLGKAKTEEEDVLLDQLTDLVIREFGLSWGESVASRVKFFLRLASSVRAENN